MLLPRALYMHNQNTYSLVEEVSRWWSSKTIRLVVAQAFQGRDCLGLRLCRDLSLIHTRTQPVKWLDTRHSFTFLSQFCRCQSHQKPHLLQMLLIFLCEPHHHLTFLPESHMFLRHIRFIPIDDWSLPDQICLLRLDKLSPLDDFPGDVQNRTHKNHGVIREERSRVPPWIRLAIYGLEQNFWLTSR